MNTWRQPVVDWLDRGWVVTVYSVDRLYDGEIIEELLT